jgi:GDP-L-fucose synthase
MQEYNDAEFINVGIGEDIAIQDLALLIKSITGYNGEIKNDLSKPDGTPRKLLDVSKLNKMGWKPAISLESGIRKVYNDYIKSSDIVSQAAVL